MPAHFAAPDKLQSGVLTSFQAVPPVTSLGRGPLSFYPILGPYNSHWLVSPEVELKLFCTEYELARWVENHKALKAAMDGHNGIRVRVAEHVHSGIITQEGVTFCGALMPSVRFGLGTHVGWLSGYREQALNSHRAIREIAESLLLFRKAMSDKGIAFNGLRPEHLFLTFDPLTRQGESDSYHAFSNYVTLMDWEGMSRVGDGSAQEADEARFTFDDYAVRDIISKLLGPSNINLEALSSRYTSDRLVPRRWLQEMKARVRACMADPRV
ncbi:hypothetical protein FA95DRAFT_1562814 [Auriscalpium vulgare]|uniref:Uncharacterized protein n=1 Tax=Auriscalpium vulgare TaxID=40419 RepID=A0ACB8RJY1_9AGAM|nr:hypothetical protein FA95DRAFT_1562814 [Auriscalpium vulgare]